MQEPTDDQLDGLFRKSAEEFNAPFDPAAWQAMKSRLDTHDRLTIWEHLLRWGLPVLLLLVLTGGSWNAHRKQVMAGPKTGPGVAVRRSTPTNKIPLPDRLVSQGEQGADNSRRLLSKTMTTLAKSIDPVKITVNQLSDDEKMTAEPAAAGNARSTNKVKRTLTTSRSHESATTKATNRNTQPDESIITGSTRVSKPPRPSYSATMLSASDRGQFRAAGVGREQPRWSAIKRAQKPMAMIFPAAAYATESARSFIEQQRVTPGETTEKLTDKPQPGINSLPATETIPAHRFSVGDALSDIPTLKRWADKPSFVELTGRPGKWPTPLSFTSRDVTAPDIAAQTEQPAPTQPVPFQRGLSVRFAVSPDLSAIGLRNFQRPGTNVGLLVEYRLASRWSVQAGVLQSTKVYKALPSDYEWPKGWNWKTMPESVDGRCNMLDIPINLRYDVALRPRLNGLTASRWFVSGGVTTYIMKQEKYVYKYPATAHIYPTTPKELNRSTGMYGFSHLNLSAGYERALSRRLSWQVEPFAKVPLRSVGFFRVNLLSTGAFFSLRYKL